MNKRQYLSEIEKDINIILEDWTLKNYKNQAFAWKLGADFNRTFSEEYLWNRALFLSSRSCIILQNDINSKIAIAALKECAEIYEYLCDIKGISAKYDWSYLSILSALCYCISGYQANAFCIASRVANYQLNTHQDDILTENDNFVINQISLILTNKLPLADYLISSAKLDYDVALSLFLTSTKSWLDSLLRLHDSDYLIKTHQTYRCYLKDGNVHISQLLLLLETRIHIYKQRSIWETLRKDESIAQNKFWKKYIKILTHDLYGFSNVKNIESRISKSEFWISQLRAIEGGLLTTDSNYVIQMPTSAGKTFIAELALLKHLISNPDKKCIYIAPFRALASEKEIELSQNLSKLGFTVSSLTGSYEVDEFQDILLDETDVLIATPEKIDMLLRLTPNYFNSVSFAVVDEGHIIGDMSSRATLLEMLIIRLRIKIHNMRILFISAVMPPHNANEYSLWLNNNENCVLRSLLYQDSNINEEWEPTRKLIGYFDWSGNTGTIRFQNVITEDEKTKIKSGAFIPSYLTHKEFSGKYPVKNNKPQTAAALAFKISEEGKTLVFCAQVPRIRSVANAFINILNDIKDADMPERFFSNINSESYHYAKMWYGEESFITKSIKNKVGIHYGDMPEQVRHSVEKDFRNGILSVLLSTNTIGQGLNFPIKNIIFYETQIGRSDEKNIYIQYRDFWNIIGRAGRAGKETEGKIIFVINSRNDKILYRKFTNKSNIEEANSLIYKVLKLLVENRISENVFSNYASILTESYLIDLISEEMTDAELNQVIGDVINHSLFKVQIEKKGIDIAPLKKRFITICNEIKSELTPSQIQAYSKTGLSKKTNSIFENYISSAHDEISGAIRDDDYKCIIWHLIQIIMNNNIKEFSTAKIYSFNLSDKELFDVIIKWICGDSIDKIKRYWAEIHQDQLKLYTLLSSGMYYIFPWAITSFLTITLLVLKIDKSAFSENIRHLSSYMKFGLNNPTASLACSLGIKNREVALALAKSANTNISQNFIRWIANLDHDEIKNFVFSDFDSENILNTALKLSLNSYRSTPQSINFISKGTYFNKSWWQTSKEISINDALSLRRDHSNQYDPYAVEIEFNGKSFAYVPREYSKFISSEIDILETNFQVTAEGIIERDQFNQIQINITFL